MKNVFGLAAALILLAAPGFAQVVLAPSGSLRIFGDSTLHKWSSTATAISMSFTMADGAPAELADAIKASAVKGLEVTISVAGLKSGETGLDKNMRKAMMEEKYPSVTFKLLKYALSAPAAGVIPAKAEGELTIAGQTKPVVIPVEFRQGPEGIFVKGGYDLKMSEYGIKPPTLMMGAIKVRDPITIGFDLLLKSASSAKKTGQ